MFFLPVQTLNAPGTPGPAVGKQRRYRLLPQLPKPVLLLVLVGILSFYGLNAGELYRTESLRAIIAAEFLRSGNWVVPTLVRRAFFFQAAGHVRRYRAGELAGRGVSEWSARLPSAIAAIATVLLVFWYFGRQLGRTAGVVAAAAVAAFVSVARQGYGGGNRHAANFLGDCGPSALSPGAGGGGMQFARGILVVASVGGRLGRRHPYEMDCARVLLWDDHPIVMLAAPSAVALVSRSLARHRPRRRPLRDVGLCCGSLGRLGHSLRDCETRSTRALVARTPSSPLPLGRDARPPVSHLGSKFADLLACSARLVAWLREVLGWRRPPLVASLALLDLAEHRFLEPCP